MHHKNADVKKICHGKKTRGGLMAIWAKQKCQREGHRERKGEGIGGRKELYQGRRISFSKNMEVDAGKGRRTLWYYQLYGQITLIRAWSAGWNSERLLKHENFRGRSLLALLKLCPRFWSYIVVFQTFHPRCSSYVVAFESSSSLVKIYRHFSTTSSHLKLFCRFSTSIVTSQAITSFSTK